MDSGFDALNLGKIALRCANDPGDTLHLELTRREVMIAMFAMHFIYNLFPEMKDDLETLCEKINEVGFAQGFLQEMEKEEGD